VKTEKRAIARGCSVERRTVDGKEKLTIGGYAAVFYRDGDATTEFDFGYGTERIMRGAFDAAIAEKQDVRALWNHDPSKILGRTKNGTLRLSVDDVGLKYEADLPETEEARGFAASIERGDVDGSSFGFMIRRNADGSMAEKWEKPDSKKKVVRSIASVNLFDVSPVTFPAYTGASVGVRDMDGGEELQRIAQEIEKTGEKQAENEQKRANELLDFELRMALVSPCVLSEDV
jgi:HK97 family phage prohead protease